MGWLSDTSQKHLMGSIHWGYDKKKTPEKLCDFIKKYKEQCLNEGIFQFLFFKDDTDYLSRFGKDRDTSVLGSRPGLYIFKPKEKLGKSLKIGQSERLHERMGKHSESGNIGGPGVVIVRSRGRRCDDQFNIHEMRKLGEVLINDFMWQATKGKVYDTVREDGPRAFVSREGCIQAKKLMESLRKPAVHTKFRSNIVPEMGEEPPTSKEMNVWLKYRGVVRFQHSPDIPPEWPLTQ